MALIMDEFASFPAPRTELKAQDPSLIICDTPYAAISSNFRLTKPTRQRANRLKLGRSTDVVIFEDDCARLVRSNLRPQAQTGEVGSAPNVANSGRKRKPAFVSCQAIRRQNPAFTMNGAVIFEDVYSRTSAAVTIPTNTTDTQRASCQNSMIRAHDPTGNHIRRQHSSNSGVALSVTDTFLGIVKTPTKISHRSYNPSRADMGVFGSTTRESQRLPLGPSSKAHQVLVDAVEPRPYARGKENIPPGLDDLSEKMENLCLDRFESNSSRPLLSFPTMNAITL